MIEIWIEPVFTAHPTESTRRTILRKQQKIAQLLLGRLGLSRTAAETRQIWDRIRSEITGGWQTAENSRERLTVADEREHVLFFIARDPVPDRADLLRGDRSGAGAGVRRGGARSASCPRSCASARGSAATWTAIRTCTPRRSAKRVARHQQIIVNRYFLECQGLAETLSQSATRVGISAALQARIEQYMTLLPGAGDAVARAARSHAVSRVPRPDDGAAARHVRCRAPITTSRPTSSSAI